MSKKSTSSPGVAKASTSLSKLSEKVTTSISGMTMKEVFQSLTEGAPDEHVVHLVDAYTKRLGWVIRPLAMETQSDARSHGGSMAVSAARPSTIGNRELEEKLAECILAILWPDDGSREQELHAHVDHEEDENSDNDWYRVARFIRRVVSSGVPLARCDLKSCLEELEAES